MSRDQVERIQRAYPRIYLACHFRHARARSTEARLSANDSAILGHLHREHPMTATVLARHLGVGKASLSATMARLVKLGYVRRSRFEGDHRAVGLTLTDQGARAMAASSVLDQARVALVLTRLRPSERVSAVAGLELLAEAANETMQVFGKEASR